MCKHVVDCRPGLGSSLLRCVVWRRYTDRWLQLALCRQGCVCWIVPGLLAATTLTVLVFSCCTLVDLILFSSSVIQLICLAYHLSLCVDSRKGVCSVNVLLQQYPNFFESKPNSGVTPKKLTHASAVFLQSVGHNWLLRSYSYTVYCIFVNWCHASSWSKSGPLDFALLIVVKKLNGNESKKY